MDRSDDIINAKPNLPNWEFLLLNANEVTGRPQPCGFGPVAVGAIWLVVPFKSCGCRVEARGDISRVTRSTHDHRTHAVQCSLYVDSS